MIKLRSIGSALVTVLMLAGATAAFAEDHEIQLRVGEVKTLQPGAVDRVAVGTASVVSTSLLTNGQLLLFGEAEGVSTLIIWDKDGSEQRYEVFVEGFEFAHARGISSLEEKYIEVQDMIGAIPGLMTTMTGSSIVLSGQYGSEYTAVIDRMKEAYPEILDLTLSTKFSEIQTILADTPGLTIRMVGDRIVLTGEVDTDLEETIETLSGAYPEMLDLTTKATLELRQEQMVMIDIKITEFNRSALDSLGINWIGSDGTSGVFTGPGGAVAAEVADGVTGGDALGITRASFAPTPFASANAAATAPFGYFGIATEVASRVSLAVSSGNATTLASPRLVARSGGEATFLAGGEIPIEIVTPTSASIEFKEFGILLNITPEVDQTGNILASVETEISAVDFSVSVGDTPGFSTRRATADISMKSGETLVLSGLVDESLSRDITGIAGLYKIPVLGRLFRSEDFRNDVSELVIFVSPSTYEANSPENIRAMQRREELIQRFRSDIGGTQLKILD